VSPGLHIFVVKTYKFFFENNNNNNAFDMFNMFKTQASRQCGRIRPLSPGCRRTGALATAVVEGVDELTVDEWNLDE
jgi:hypothetical protein